MKVILITLFKATSTALFAGSAFTIVSDSNDFIVTVAYADTVSTVDVIFEVPGFLAVKIVDAAPLIILAVNGLTVPNVSLAKFTVIPSGT